MGSLMHKRAIPLGVADQAAVDDGDLLPLVGAELELKSDAGAAQLRDEHRVGEELAALHKRHTRKQIFAFGEKLQEVLAHGMFERSPTKLKDRFRLSMHGCSPRAKEPSLGSHIYDRATRPHTRLGSVCSGVLRVIRQCRQRFLCRKGLGPSFACT